MSLKSEISHYRTATSKITHHSDGSTSKHHAIIEERNETPPLPTKSELTESVQPSPSTGAIDDYEPGGNHYEMGDNGNGNSDPKSCARYPRMAEEIGDCNAPEATGRDRIQLEHDDMLIHRR